MYRALVSFGTAAIFVAMLSSDIAMAQLAASTNSNPVKIVDGPALELARGDFAIIRWTTTNPGGSDEHFAVVHYGTDCRHLDLTEKSHIRLNPGHPKTTFRVRMIGLKPRTTYCYCVTSMGSAGDSDGERSPVHDYDTCGRREISRLSPLAINPRLAISIAAWS